MHVNQDLLKRCSLTRNIATWVELLGNDTDAEFLLNGIAWGFRVVDENVEIKGADCKNYSSALFPKYKPQLDKIFRAEIEMGRYSQTDVKPKRIHAIGAVEKKSSGVPRPITDCSMPKLDAINTYITPPKFSFESMDDALAQSSPNCFFAVVDIQSAFRWVPLYPPHRNFLGVRWAFDGEAEKMYVDNFLCFGLSSSPYIFFKISSAIARMMRREGFKVSVYLDDFLLIADTFAACHIALLRLITLLRTLGFVVKWDKVQSPTQRVSYLGLIIDSRAGKIFLPQDKLNSLILLCSSLLDRKKVSKKELQALVGHMSFASRAIFGARTFARIFVDATKRLEQPSHKLRLNNQLQEELR